MGTVTAYKLVKGGGEGLEGLSPKGLRKIHAYSAVVKWHKTKLWCFYAMGDLELVESEQERHRSIQRRKTEGALPHASAVAAAAAADGTQAPAAALKTAAASRRSTDLPGVRPGGAVPQEAAAAVRTVPAEEHEDVNELGSDSDAEQGGQDGSGTGAAAKGQQDQEEGGPEADDDGVEGEGEAEGGDWV